MFKNRQNQSFFSTPTALDEAKMLLQLIMDGCLEEVRQTLNKPVYFKHAIITQRTQGMEYQRHWKNISPLQYVAWAGDGDMLDLLLKNLSVQEKRIALFQLKEMKELGIQFGKPLAPLIKLVEAYHRYLSHAGLSTDWADEKTRWVKEVGQAQANLPIFALQYLCSSVSITETSLTLSGFERHLNSFDGYRLWPLSESKLGVDYALIKMRDNETVAFSAVPRRQDVESNCAAFESLVNRHTKKMIEQIEILEKACAHQVSFSCV